MREAFRHAKAISGAGEAAELFASAGVSAGMPRPAGVSTGADVGALTAAFTADIAVHRHWDRAAKDAMAA